MLATLDHFFANFNHICHRIILSYWNLRKRLMRLDKSKSDQDNLPRSDDKVTRFGQMPLTLSRIWLSLIAVAQSISKVIGGIGANRLRHVQEM